MGFTCNYKIAYSGCQDEIEDNFWKTLKQKPLEYFIGEKLDVDEIRKPTKQRQDPLVSEFTNSRCFFSQNEDFSVPPRIVLCTVSPAVAKSPRRRHFRRSR